MKNQEQVEAYIAERVAQLAEELDIEIKLTLDDSIPGFSLVCDNPDAITDIVVARLEAIAEDAMTYSRT